MAAMPAGLFHKRETEECAALHDVRESASRSVAFATFWNSLMASSNKPFPEAIPDCSGLESSSRRPFPELCAEFIEYFLERAVDIGEWSGISRCGA